jgi:hypothetical protein
MNMEKWTKALAFTFGMSIAATLAAADGGRSEEQAKQATPATEIESPKELTATAQSSGEDYVVVMTDKDTTPLSVYQKYLESADLWRQLTEHNLLKDGTTVRIPKNMLKDGQIPAKVSKFNGNVEIARNFDWKWVSVVDNMLVQEGDWIRTRAKSSAEILQDDGTVIVLRPNTKMLFEANGTAQTARGEVRTTKVKLDEGSILSRVKKLAQRDSRFEISTPTATSFIRGTEFRVKVEAEGATRLEVLEGRVDFGEANQNVSVDGNFGSLVTAQGAMPEAPHALPAAPAALLSPENRQVLEGDLAMYNFAWSSVQGAVRYHLEVAADAEFKQLVDETWVDGTSAQVQSLDLSDLEPGTYFWRVSALDAQSYESAWSQTSHFIYPMKLR